MRWLLVLLSGAAALGYARWVYRRKELPVAGAGWLAWLRAASLFGVAGVLVNPLVPGSGGTQDDRWVLLDASVSMAAGGGADSGGPTAWSVAQERARDLAAQGWRVVTFGHEVRLPPVLADTAPEEMASRLAPALTLAAEGGARTVRVLSDMRLEDEVAVRGVLASVPVAVSFERFGADVPNAGVSTLGVPDRRSTEAAATATVEVHGGEVGSLLTVELLEEGVPVGSAVVEAPAAGLRRTVEIPLPAARANGWVRYEARLVGGPDAFAADDRVATYARVGTAAGAGVVLVSFAPDWEPRVLLPVLERTTGLSGAGFLQVGPDRFVTVGRAADRGAPVDGAEVRRVAEGAELLVLHGVRGGSPSWVTDLTGGGARRIVFPTGPEGAALFGLQVTAPLPGSWFAVPDLPGSPVAGALTGSIQEGLPPLRGVLVAQEDGGGARVLSVRRQEGGGEEAALLLRTSDAAREAVVLVTGFWRWAARPAGREAYDALWSGVAGWLLRDPVAGSGAFEPVRRVVPVGEEVDWRVPEDRTGYGLRIDGDSGVVADTLFDQPGTATLGPFPSGQYRYTVLDAAGDSVDAGRFDVSGGTTDMAHPPLDPGGWSVGAAASAPGGTDGRTPLRTLPWPYLFIIGCLCAEWVGRRRSGLR